ncbi:hypothetical protein PInf_018899 [Phytophthora infestans]|nr:hypothetical protein PInf_018899 [Phytophthora infestans]
MRIIRAAKTTWIEPGEAWELPYRIKWVEYEKLWITRGEKWVPTVIQGPGRSRYLQVTNISDKRLLLDQYEEVGRWLAKDGIPRRPGEWQNLAYAATTEIESLGEVELPAERTGPLVDRPSYPTPRKTLLRDRRIGIQVVEAGSDTAGDTQSRFPGNPESVDGGSQRMEAGSRDSADPQLDPSFPLDRWWIRQRLKMNKSAAMKAGIYTPRILEMVPLTTEEVTIDDIQVNPGANEPAEVDRLRQKIWESRHLLIGKGNALPPAARGVKCDIDVCVAKPIAQRVWKVAPQFREKLSDLIKGLLQAKIISFSTSPWASPVVIIVKKNGTWRVDIGW